MNIQQKVARERLQNSLVNSWTRFSTSKDSTQKFMQIPRAMNRRAAATCWKKQRLWAR